jgi:DNA repair exonuclease SbcCD ATPase subunit
MRLLHMRLRNFMRFKRAEVALADQGLTLIEGVNLDDESATSNGAGKSTLVDALVWCLYGVTTHDPAAEGDDVVNEKRAINCEVRVEFVVGEHQHYSVTRRRAWKKGGKAVQLLFDTWDPNTTSGAAGSLTKGTIKDTQRAIDRLIGLSLATFKHSCVFGQSRAYHFSRLTDAEKKAVLDEMLGSEIYAKAGQKAGERLTLAERELEKAQMSLETATESRQEAQTRLDDLRERQERIVRQNAKERESLKCEVADLSKRLADLGDFEEIVDVHALTRATKQAMAEVRKARSIADKSAGLIETLEAARKRMQKQDGTTCITCAQTIASAHVAKQLEVIDQQIEETNHIDHVAQEKLAAAQSELTKAEQAEEKASDKSFAVSESNHKRRRLADKLSAAKRALAKLTQDDFTDLIEKEESRLQRHKETARALRKSILKLAVTVAQLKFWHQGFSAKGLRSLMLDGALPYLNAKLDTYTNALTAGNIKVEFQTQRVLKSGNLREDFHIVVSNKYGSTKYTMNSVGERAKIDIIVGLALQDMAASRSRVPVNVAFFDEVFDGLDNRGTDRAVQVLSQLKRESAFVITHNEALKPFFNKRIRVVKKNGESRLE